MSEYRPTVSRERLVEMPASTSIGDWRRICLERQLPRARFPAGIRVPIAVCFGCLVLLAGLSVIYLGSSGRRSVPPGVMDSQEDLVTRLARGLNTTSSEGLEDLVRAGDRYAADPAQDPAALLAAVDGAGKFRGTVVLDGATRQPVTARGEAIPVDKVPAGPAKSTLVPVLVPGQEPMLLAVVPLAAGRVLVASSSLRVRLLQLNPDARQSVLIVTRGSDIIDSQGAPVAPDDAAVHGLIRGAVARASDIGPTSTTGRLDPVDPTRRAHGSRTAPVVAAAPVGDLDLAVASVVHVPVVQGAGRWQGLPAAASLLALAGLAFLMIYAVLVRPVRRLLLQAKAVACGELGPRSRPSRISEVRRVAVALREAGSQIRGHRGRATERGLTLSVNAAVAVVAMAIIAWSAAVVVSYAQGTTEVPQQIRYDTQNQVDSVAGAIHDRLTEAVTRLTAVATETAGAGDDQWRPALTRFTSQDGRRYRSAYVVDEAGRPLTVVGRKPLRPADPLDGDGGLRVGNVGGPVPAVYAYARPSGNRWLVAEFDIHYLISLLTRVDGRLRVVDAKLRTILDTSGFVAFQKLSSQPLRQAAAEALSGKPRARVSNIGGVGELLASSPVGTVETAYDLAWVVVAERPVREYRLPGNDLRRGAWLVAFLGVCLALLLAGWHAFVLVGPLRQLARIADGLVRGDDQTVVAAARQDEIGAVAVCLEISRQARVYGIDRLAGAVRLRGDASDHTYVIPRVPGPRKSHDQTAKKRGRGTPAVASTGPARRGR